MAEILLLLFVITLCAMLLTGFPVAFVLAGVSVWFAVIGHFLGAFDLGYLEALPSRIYGTMTNPLLLAVPLFVFMGVVLERAKIAEELLETMTSCFRNARAGLGISVVLVGALLAASTGIVGATVVTMGLISLPCMLRNKYSPEIATGTICAAGTLGQIIPPSIVLILLGDQISNANQTAQMQLGNMSAEPVSVADLFMGALVPGGMLVVGYITLLLIQSYLKPASIPRARSKDREEHLYLQALKVLAPPLLLMTVVLGSILSGIATATESASVGAVGALVLATARGKLSYHTLRHCCRETALISAMVFGILIGASFFTLVFRGYGGDDIVHTMLSSLPGGLFGALVIVMIAIFLLGFLLDFIEIIFVVVPIVVPILLLMGADPIWLAIMIAINLQTSFLTPPFGFALFYLRGVVDSSIQTIQIYRGVVPFIAVQIIVLFLIAIMPSLATWLPYSLRDTQPAAENMPVDTDFLTPYADDNAVDF